MTPDAYLTRHSGRLVATLRDLVRHATVNPPGDHYGAVTADLAQRLRTLGLRTKHVRVPAALARRVLPPEQHGHPRYNVLGFWRVPGAKRTVHFNAHYDVVPVSGTWRHGDPFSGTVQRGWIFGRGTADMKGSIASLLLALEALKATGATPRVNVEVSFVADEETDSELGSGWVVKHAPIAPDYAIVMEGGEGNAVCCGHNGVVWLEVQVQGRAAHGSRPDRGINALEKMAALLGELTVHKQELAQRTFLTPEGLTMRPTINLGGIFGQGPGGKINTVPADAHFSIDRRVLGIETVPAAEAELRAALAAAAARVPGGCTITVRKVSENFPCFTAPEHPFFRAMADCVTQVRRQPAVFNVSTGFNDMHFFASELGVPTLGYGPGGEDYHAVNERASVRELVRSARIYARLLTTFEG